MGAPTVRSRVRDIGEIQGVRGAHTLSDLQLLLQREEGGVVDVRQRHQGPRLGASGGEGLQQGHPHMGVGGTGEDPLFPAQDGDSFQDCSHLSRSKRQGMSNPLDSPPLVRGRRRTGPQHTQDVFQGSVGQRWGCRGLPADKMCSNHPEPGHLESLLVHNAICLEIPQDVIPSELGRVPAADCSRFLALPLVQGHKIQRDMPIPRVSHGQNVGPRRIQRVKNRSRSGLVADPAAVSRRSPRKNRSSISSIHSPRQIVQNHSGVTGRHCEEMGDLGRTQEQITGACLQENILLSLRGQAIVGSGEHRKTLHGNWYLHAAEPGALRGNDGQTGVHASFELQGEGCQPSLQPQQLPSSSPAAIDQYIGEEPVVSRPGVE
mmetsp:Transcript_60822/g.140541  ORF Transcript_60822/g.140541 Transcript_60822/m.140541 type:complete len:376 (+) Transcript_60822:298-1425(+)